MLPDVPETEGLIPWLVVVGVVALAWLGRWLVSGITWLGKWVFERLTWYQDKQAAAEAAATAERDVAIRALQKIKGRLAVLEHSNAACLTQLHELEQTEEVELAIREIEHDQHEITKLRATPPEPQERT